MDKKIEVIDNGNVFRCDSNITYCEYQRLRECGNTKEMSPADVIKYVADHFGFDATKVEPLMTLPMHVFVGSGCTMMAEGTIKRHPQYNSTDWNYMLFEVCGIKWEVINGSLEQVVE